MNYKLQKSVCTDISKVTATVLYFAKNRDKLSPFPILPHFLFILLRGIVTFKTIINYYDPAHICLPSVRIKILFLGTMLVRSF